MMAMGLVLRAVAGSGYTFATKPTPGYTELRTQTAAPNIYRVRYLKQIGKSSFRCRGAICGLMRWQLQLRDYITHRVKRPKYNDPIIIARQGMGLFKGRGN